MEVELLSSLELTLAYAISFDLLLVLHMVFELLRALKLIKAEAYSLLYFDFSNATLTDGLSL